MAPESAQMIGDFVFGNGVSSLSPLADLGSGRGLYDPNTGKQIGSHHRSSPVGDLKVSPNSSVGVRGHAFVFKEGEETGSQPS